MLGPLGRCDVESWLLMVEGPQGTGAVTGLALHTLPISQAEPELRAVSLHCPGSQLVRRSRDTNPGLPPFLGGAWVASGQVRWAEEAAARTPAWTGSLLLLCLGSIPRARGGAVIFVVLTSRPVGLVWGSAEVCREHPLLEPAAP